MSDGLVIFTFCALLALNVLATFVYMVGFEQVKAYARKSFKGR